MLITYLLNNNQFFLYKTKGIRVNSLRYPPSYAHFTNTCRGPLIPHVVPQVTKDTRDAVSTERACLFEGGCGTWM